MLDGNISPSSTPDTGFAGIGSQLLAARRAESPGDGRAWVVIGGEGLFEVTSAGEIPHTMSLSIDAPDWLGG